MDLFEFIEFVNIAKEKDQEERIYQQWCAMLPTMNEYKSFGEFKDILTGANLDLRPADVIIAEIEELHRKKGE